MWMMSVPIATCAVAGMPARAAAARMLVRRKGRRARRMASPIARPSPTPAATPSRVARFRNSPVSRAIPKVPRSRPGPTSSEVRSGHQALPPGERHGAHARHVERDESAAPTPRASHLRPPEQAALDELAEHVPDQDVRLLDARRVRARRHAQAEIDQTLERPAVATGEADGLDAELPAHLDRAQYARGAAAGGDGERDVAPGAERAHLAREHLVVAVVVGDGGERRAVGGERD